MEHMERIKQLVALCNSAERYRIAMMLGNAADYVRAVAIMETVAARVEDFEPEEFRAEREATDRTRTNEHNAFISSVDAVNRICDAHGVARIYKGSTARREYGDFALELVTDIFVNRH